MLIKYMVLSVLIILGVFCLSRKANKFLVACSVITSIIYITWRFTTLPKTPFNMILGIILLIAEIIGFLQFLVFSFVSSKEPNKHELDTTRTSLPTVDIIIPTYGEPIEILKQTVAAVISLKYEEGKKQIYLCDDGKRQAVKDMCDEFGIHYVIRPDNSHNKSGNINNCLKIATGELMVVFDADMMPKSNFLLKMAPYFFDENIGFVQAPQTFYNADVFQRSFGGNIPSEQDFFMRDVQARRSGINAAIHVGTNAMFRRKCIDEIGGYPTFSITEDIAVGMMIQSLGYKMIYVNEALVLGLHPTNIKDLLGQRDRWCRGNLQLLKFKNPFKEKGLTFGQKLIYFDGVFYWYTSLLKMIFIIAPLLFLVTGTFFIDAPIDKLISIFIPYYISQYLVFSAAYGNTRSMLWGHIYETILAPYLSSSCIKQFFSNNLIFKVTNKNKNTNVKYYFKELMPHIILITLTIIGWIFGFIKLMDGTINLPIFLINFVWTLYNVVPMFMALLLGFEREEKVNDDIDIKDKNINVIIDGKQNRIHSISYNKITVYQQNSNILLKEQVVEFEMNNQKFTGIVTNSLKGKATIEIKDADIKAFTSLISIYIDSLTPYYDLNIGDEINTNLKINNEGELEWEILD